MINIKNSSKLILILVLVLLVSCTSVTKVRKPEFLIDVTTLDFGDVMVGDMTNAQQVTISNDGNGKLNVYSIVLSGADSADFYLMENSPIVVYPKSSTSFEVKFGPSASGDKTAVVTIEHDALDSPATVTLTGKGKDPALPHCDISPNTYDFGSVVMGQSSNSFKFTISNPGNAPLSVTNIDLSGTDAAEFALTVATPLPFDVQSMASEEFSVVFNPLNIGLKTAVVTITHNATTSPDTVQLVGTGLTNETVIFEDDFTAPKAWFYVNDSAHTSAANWDIYIPPNYTGGTGNFASADSRITPNDVFSQVLVTPNIDCSAFTSGTIRLEFDGYYEDNATSVVGDMAAIFNMDVTSTTVSVISTIEVYQTGWGSGQHKVYDITGIASGKSKFAIGFYYYGQNDYWFDIDNVKIIHKP